ncbi:MAG TPA: diguanylate cyclase [Terriglobales bacterium]|jgi:diguanylate cyclase (GGDEF)-like protein
MGTGLSVSVTGEGSIYADGEQFRVLVADDSPVYSTLIRQALTTQPWSLLFAKNGHEAINIFAEHRPQLVLTDWVMPEVSGPELCRRIRHDFADRYTYLILLTSNSEKDSVIAGLATGADDYLTKPFHPGELVARVGVGRRIIELQNEIQTKNRLLEQMALTDPLTGLPNRRAIDVWAPRQLSAAARHGFPMWVAMADLDHFKKINDTYGHAAGDAVLQGFAKILKNNTRESNICGRIGGEEFLLVLTHADRANVETAIDRIRAATYEQMFRSAGQALHVTASFGVAGFQGKQAPEFNRLAEAADAALYSAKQNGRNRIEFRMPV